MGHAETEARRALTRLRRALEKGRREVSALEGALRRAEGDDFPDEAYAEARDAIGRLMEFADREGRRLQYQLLIAGGLEPGRVRRVSARDG